MRAIPAHPFARLQFEPMAIWLAGTDDGIVISTGWAGDPLGSQQAGAAIPLAAIRASVTTDPAAIAGGTFQRIETTKA